MLQTFQLSVEALDLSTEFPLSFMVSAEYVIFRSIGTKHTGMAHLCNGLPSGCHPHVSVSSVAMRLGGNRNISGRDSGITA
jgi:hypothetical protein